MKQTTSLHKAQKRCVLTVIDNIVKINYVTQSYRGQVALEGNFRFGLDKSDLKSANDKKFVRKATGTLKNRVCEQNTMSCYEHLAIEGDGRGSPRSCNSLTKESTGKIGCSRQHRDSATNHLSNRFQIKTPSQLFSKICLDLACSRGC